MFGFEVAICDIGYDACAFCAGVGFDVDCFDGVVGCDVFEENVFDTVDISAVGWCGVS